MKPRLVLRSALSAGLRRAAILAAATALTATPAISTAAEVGASPWGKSDEIGTLNLMTDSSRLTVLQRVTSGKVYDLSVEYFVGMPSWHGVGDPRYQFWLTHTPRGTAIDDPMRVGHKENATVSYTGDAVSMYTHMGTHIDALNHFGLHGKIWNGFSADEHLGDRGWKRAGAEKIPPIVARGVLLDIAAANEVAALPPLYRVKLADIRRALTRQKLKLERGDVVLIRTGRMKDYENAERFMADPPGLSMEAARFLVETGGAMVIGADNLSLETFPPEEPGNYVPVHTYLLAERGVSIMELVNLEQLARDGVHEFAFIGGSLKLRGASAAPMRPVAIPIRQTATK